MGKLVSKAELSEILGISTQAIDAMIRRGCPYQRKGGRGREWSFDTAAVREWREERIRAERERGGDAAEVINLDAERLKKLAAERRLAEHELARVTGEVVAIDSVGEAVEHEYVNLRARLELIPNKLAPRLPRIRKVTEARELLRAEIREALNELSSGDEIARLVAGGQPASRSGAEDDETEGSPATA